MKYSSCTKIGQVLSVKSKLLSDGLVVLFCPPSLISALLLDEKHKSQTVLS